MKDIILNTFQLVNNNSRRRIQENRYLSGIQVHALESGLIPITLIPQNINRGI